MKSRGTAALLLALPLTACAASMTGPPAMGETARYYAALREDRYGRGRFSQPLNQKTEEQPYYLVYGDDSGRPRTSFRVIPRKPNVGRPFHKIVYRWTKNGYQAGLEMAKDGLNSYAKGSSDGMALVYLVVLGGLPIIASTTVGFLKGLAHGSPRLARDVKRAISPTSIVVEYRAFVYDHRGRIVREDVRASTDKVRLLSRKEFHYSGNRTGPCRVNIINYPNPSRSRSTWSKRDCAPGDLPAGLR